MHSEQQCENQNCIYCNPDHPLNDPDTTQIDKLIDDTYNIGRTDESLQVDNYTKLKPGILKKAQELTDSEVQRRVLEAQINMVEYYDQIPTNDEMDWKGLFKDSLQVLKHDLAKLNKPEIHDE